jgi:ribose transport system ATP-binding protein
MGAAATPTRPQNQLARPTAVDSTAMTLLEVRDLSKSFGETRALISCTLTAERSQVHAVLGENGSGKSTLVKILSGVIAPDGGELRIAGGRMTQFSPGAARAVGVAPVLQEVLVAPNRTVLDNIFLGHDSLVRRALSRPERRERAHAALARITHTPPHLDAFVGDLALSQRQLVTVARALVRNPRVLILDEATSALDVGDRQVLFEAMRELVADGSLVIFISHRLEEVMEISDLVTVLRSGMSIETLRRGEFDVHDLLRLMSPNSAERLGRAHEIDV